MFYFVDLFILFLLGLVINSGIKGGATGMLRGLGSFILRAVVVALGMVLMLLLFHAIGAISGLTSALRSFVGESSLYDSKLIANILAVFVFALIAFIIGHVIVFAVFKLINKVQIKELQGGYKVANKIIGCILAIVFFLVIYAIILAFIYVVSEKGILTATDELFRATKISSLLYNNNPFVSLVQPIFA